MLKANDYRKGYVNGKIVTVARVEGHVVTTADNLKIDTNRFKLFDYGYTVTSHKSPGKTTDEVIVAAERLEQGRLCRAVAWPQ